MKYIFFGAVLGFVLLRYAGIGLGAFLGYLIGESLERAKMRKSQSPKESISTKTELEKAYATLGIPYSANFEDIRKAYRQKCKALHPDTLNSKKLNKIALSAIEKELRCVIEAYELILKSRQG